MDFITSFCKSDESKKIKDAVDASSYGSEFVHAALSVDQKVMVFIIAGILQNDDLVLANSIETPFCLGIERCTPLLGNAALHLLSYGELLKQNTVYNLSSTSFEDRLIMIEFNML